MLAGAAFCLLGAAFSASPNAPSLHGFAYCGCGDSELLKPSILDMGSSLIVHPFLRSLRLRMTPIMLSSCND